MGASVGEKNPPTVGDIVPWAGDFELSEREAITSLSFLSTVDAL